MDNIQAPNILVVDDTPENLNVLTNILITKSYEIRPVPSGALALQAAFARPPDLVLLDIMMPDMDGYEVCTQLKADPRTRDIPVIFISALEEIEDKIRAFEVGGVDYLTKPFQAEEVLARVAAHLALVRTQQELHNSRLQLQAVINNAAVCIGMLDVNGYYQQVNGKCAEIFGYPQAELIGMRCLELNHPDYRPPTEKALQALRAGELDTFQMDKQFIRKDGSLIWASHWLNPLSNADGVCEGFVCVIVDLTERKQAEETVRKLSRAVEQSHNTIVITNTRGMIEFTNPAFSHITGYSAEEALGKTPSILKSGKQDSDVYKALWDTLKQGNTWNGEMCNKRKDGSLYWEQACITPVKDEQGKTTSYIAIKEDITARKAAEDALKEKNEALVQLNQEKNEFLGMAAHDLKNPLASIRGIAQLIKIKAGADTTRNIPIRHYADEIETSAQKMFTLITNLLDVNAIESGKLAINFEHIECTEVLQAITEHYKLPAADKNTHLHLTMPPQPPPVLSNADTLRQVLDNLISNAVKYSPPDSQVNISLHVKPDKLQIHVQDQGPGFTQADKAKLFGKFSRLSAQPTGGEHSTGLGLFIVKKLTEALNAKVWCESEAGQGACFILELPVVKSKRHTLDPNLRILLAEDNLVNQKIGLIILKKLGLQADVAATGQEVLEALTRQSYDIILMDIQMPDMDGIQATAAIHRQYGTQRPRIIALTANATGREECLNAGMDGYLLKPFNMENLVQALTGVI
ncbi:response regulator [Candidatus Venteria ishoeyi]|uniref:histidine kinase n=1 Tax=Candidatus Venteria ishoeyi TaxID=1899563 RepID=A0A1H6F689_9GAMM|nr:response regulator [Candidatus Venteria ishoeyi]MDM8547359.1 response regulator [Candidatus Venteria ishoeyi]SEH05632.1 Aerobic respiration control sensor protein ArcB [Candidatus Venteria ishoeyi]SEH07494.1 Aerobic respiration control sensor protein ArcB [Candidatus Venteria ishoeyi]